MEHTRDPGQFPTATSNKHSSVMDDHGTDLDRYPHTKNAAFHGCYTIIHNWQFFKEGMYYVIDESCFCAEETV